MLQRCWMEALCSPLLQQSTPNGFSISDHILVCGVQGNGLLRVSLMKNRERGHLRWTVRDKAGTGPPATPWALRQLLGAAVPYVPPPSGTARGTSVGPWCCPWTPRRMDVLSLHDAHSCWLALVSLLVHPDTPLSTGAALFKCLSFARVIYSFIFLP